MISVAARNLCRLSDTVSVVPEPLVICGSARMIASGSWVPVTPGIWIGSSGKVMPRSQSHVPSRQPSARHRFVRSRMASVGSAVVIQRPLKQAWTSAWRRVASVGEEVGAGGGAGVLFVVGINHFRVTGGENSVKTSGHC